MEARDAQRLFGERVKALRKQKGMTQEELAEAVGKSVDTISNIERGFASTRIKTAMKIADVLGKELADLFKLSPTSGKGGHHQQFMDQMAELTEGCDAKTLDAVIEAAQFAIRVAK